MKNITMKYNWVSMRPNPITTPIASDVVPSLKSRKAETMTSTRVRRHVHIDVNATAPLPTSFLLFQFVPHTIKVKRTCKKQNTAAPHLNNCNSNNFIRNNER